MRVSCLLAQLPREISTFRTSFALHSCPLIIDFAHHRLIIASQLFLALEFDKMTGGRFWLKRGSRGKGGKGAGAGGAGGGAGGSGGGGKTPGGGKAAPSDKTDGVELCPTCKLPGHVWQDCVGACAHCSNPASHPRAQCPYGRVYRAYPDDAPLPDVSASDQLDTLSRRLNMLFGLHQQRDSLLRRRDELRRELTQRQDQLAATRMEGLESTGAGLVVAGPSATTPAVTADSAKRVPLKDLHVPGWTPPHDTTGLSKKKAKPWEELNRLSKIEAANRLGLLDNGNAAANAQQRLADLGHGCGDGNGERDSGDTAQRPAAGDAGERGSEVTSQAPAADADMEDPLDWGETAPAWMDGYPRERLPSGKWRIDVDALLEEQPGGKGDGAEKKEDEAA